MQEKRISALLRPWLGQALLDFTGICDGVGQLLDAFDVMHGNYADLFEGLKSLLVRTVYHLTKGSFVVVRDDMRQVRVRMEDFALMADALLYLKFCTLVHSAWNCNRVREYALSHDSLSALRALYVDFGEFQTAEEKEMLAYTVRTCHPAFRWRSWLPEDGENQKTQ